MTRSRHRGLLLSAALVSGAALALAACGSSSTAGDAGGSVIELAGTTWVLESYAGPDGEKAAVAAPGNAAPLTFGTDGRFTGSTGCNRMGGTYTQDGSALTLELGPMTLMACMGPVAAQEDALVDTLPQVASFTSDGSLVLLSSDGSTLLTYAPGLTSLVGTSWQATGINNGKEAVVSMAGTEKVTAVFGEDGQLSGSGGCNTYSATYEVSAPDGLVIGPIAATEMACTEDEAMQIEQEYFAALDTVTTYQLEGDQLILRDEGGATQVTYLLAPG